MKWIPRRSVTADPRASGPPEGKAREAQAFLPLSDSERRFTAGCDPRGIHP
jgi:hypothetical protein